MKQQKRITLDPEVHARALPFDPIRLEQFVALERSLLEPTGDAAALADRLVQGVVVFLGVTGAAVGFVQDGLYRMVATYGLDPQYALRYEGLSPRESVLTPALVTGRPLVLAERDADADGLQSVVLPFHGPELAGAIHLILPTRETLVDEDLALAHVLAMLAGVALTNVRQNQRLTQLARLKGDALTAMAHDLRAPLNALVGYTSLLGEGAFGPLTPEQHDVSATLERQAIELVDLLGATLDVARLETGRLPIRSEEFSLGDLLLALRTGTFARASREGVFSYRLPPDLPRLRTDRVKVKEILQNLIDNALKHSGGAVEVDVALVPDRETLRITVRDSGPGIAADVLPHLFEPFRSNSERGTGFGLYLVRSFAEALGGRVAARSCAGEGTAVTVELPLVAPAR